MADIIRFIAAIMNEIHDIIMNAAVHLGLQATDKDLHLWIIGIIGILSLFILSSKGSPNGASQSFPSSIPSHSS